MSLDDEPKLDELLLFIARSLVDEPSEVRVGVVDGDRATVYELQVAEDDLGKVIGKDGRTARAIRALLASTSARVRKRAILEILE